MPKKITIGTYDKKHRENLAKRAKNVRQLYEAAIGRIMGKAASALSDTDAEKEFRFDDFPVLNKEVDALMQDLADSLQANIEQGDEESWTLANTKNDAMVDSIIGRKRLPSETVAEWKHPHLEALSAFINRKEAGMNLSKRVWNLSEQFKAELELALELGMGQGKSAAELSRDVRRYLKYPDKLFRRVRDKSGALRLSKAAAAFHPGRGVYRSSYKNALRMTATENNIAYRTADHNRWQALPFVLGIEVRISNNHPTPDICDTFDGKRFPKDFKFTGWHPWCRCYAVSVLASQEEMDAYTQAIIDGEDVSNWKFKGQIDKMPEEFTGWIKDNEQRIAKAKSLPYFIKDNKELVERAAKIEERKALYERLKGDNDYTGVKFDEALGGLKATHRGHNLDKKKGWYETAVQNVGYNAGNAVILEKEDHTVKYKKNTEGTWNGMKMEIAGAESGTANNIRNALKHCASKGDTQMAIVFMPYYNSTYDILGGINKFEGLKNKGDKQWKKFVQIIFMDKDKIIKTYRQE